jgi:hypothetical protein
MPSVSKKQARFMQAAAHNPAFAKKAGIPQSVAQEFTAADKAKAVQGIAQSMAKRR